MPVAKVGFESKAIAEIGTYDFELASSLMRSTANVGQEGFVDFDEIKQLAPADRQGYIEVLGKIASAAREREAAHEWPQRKRPTPGQTVQGPVFERFFFCGVAYKEAVTALHEHKRGLTTAGKHPGSVGDQRRRRRGPGVFLHDQIPEDPRGRSQDLLALLRRAILAGLSYGEAKTAMYEAKSAWPLRARRQGRQCSRPPRPARSLLLRDPLHIALPRSALIHRLRTQAQD